MNAGMLAELGHMLLIAALVISIAQAVLPMVGARRGDAALMAFGDRAALLHCLALTGAIIALAVSFLNLDFSVKLVAGHADSVTPWLYRITGVWSNHEGSILLWVFVLSVYGAMLPIFGRSLPKTLKARAIAIQGLISFGFIGFTVLTSNPFERLIPGAYEGAGLNPVLQDPAAAFHPPFLYLGYVGFSLSMSLACAALLEGKVDAMWARWLRPWVLLAWSFLTIGITLGSFWAYYELGWGGWWMWDPVENVSFMPWLAATALVHSILVLSTRQSLPSWTVLLAITTFSLSLIGTFVVRSGLLTSVHAFADDPARGIYLLMILGLVTGGALLLYAMRAKMLQAHDRFEPLSRSGALVINNLLLIVLTVTVFLGTFYPVFQKGVFSTDLSIGRPYYNLTFVPIMIVLILLMGAGPHLKWERDTPARLKSIALKSIPVLSVALVLGLLLGFSVFAAIGLMAGLYLIAGTLAVIWARRKILARQTAAFYGFIFGHLGIAIMTLAITLFTSGQSDKTQRLKIGEQFFLDQYEFELTDFSSGLRDNYKVTSARLMVSKQGQPLWPLTTETRNYPDRRTGEQGTGTTEAGFKLGAKDTIFVTMSDWNEDGVIIKANYHPFVIWIWLGALMIALGGFVSLADRRLRLSPSRKEEVKT